MIWSVASSAIAGDVLLLAVLLIVAWAAALVLGVRLLTRAFGATSVGRVALGWGLQVTGVVQLAHAAGPEGSVALQATGYLLGFVGLVPLVFGPGSPDRSASDPSPEEDADLSR